MLAGLLAGLCYCCPTARPCVDPGCFLEWYQLSRENLHNHVMFKFKEEYVEAKSYQRTLGEVSSEILAKISATFKRDSHG